MSIKWEWIDQFVDKLIDYDEAYFTDRQYAYQMATAYFDWADVDQPEYTVEEAFKIFLNRQCFS